MASTQGKTFVIVYNSATKQCAGFLHGLIGELALNGASINAIIYDEKAFAKLPPENKLATQRILYIGDFPESRLVSKNIIKWQFNKFKFRYGWLGGKATTIYGGSFEVQNNIISKRILGLPDPLSNS